MVDVPVALAQAAELTARKTHSLGSSRHGGPRAAQTFAPAVKIYHSCPQRPGGDPGKRALRHDYPAAPIGFTGVTYPSAGHA
ncbi:hypothetical protein WKI68_02155 [Streptomyces sp. MS1.HAVA.3]|uniref:Uncharacterized protein n=1 Tax=Streptomyces caledonius TaxID=3134107 RepID=A0ABU8TY67_9ACTN